MIEVDDACAAPAGYVMRPGDCDDGNARIYPEAMEFCNGDDDNCDGVYLPGEVDGDKDRELACHGDCDDHDREVNSFAVEQQCDGEDDDCDGNIDEGVRSPLREAAGS